MKTYLKILLVFTLLISTAFAVSTTTTASNIFLSVLKATNSQQETTIKLIETYYTALNQDNMDQFFSIMDPDVIHDIDQGNIEQGIGKFKVFMQKGDASFKEKLSDIIIMVSDDGKYAAAHWIDHGVYYKDFAGMGIAAKDQHYALAGGHFFEIRNGKIYRVTTYYNLADFMKQVKQAH